MEFLKKKMVIKGLTRKSFLLAGLSLSVSTFFLSRKRPVKKNTVKFLTRDGKLVEIDVDRLPAAKRIASAADIQNWIKK